MLQGDTRFCMTSDVTPNEQTRAALSSLSSSVQELRSIHSIRNQPGGLDLVAQQQSRSNLMYHHVKKLMFTVRVDEPDPRFGNMLLEQFGGANGELAPAMQYSSRD